MPLFPPTVFRRDYGSVPFSDMKSSFLFPLVHFRNDKIPEAVRYHVYRTLVIMAYPFYPFNNKLSKLAYKNLPSSGFPPQSASYPVGKVSAAVISAFPCKLVLLACGKNNSTAVPQITHQPVIVNPAGFTSVNHDYLPSRYVQRII